MFPMNALTPLNCSYKSQVLIVWPSCSKSNIEVVYKDLEASSEKALPITGYPLINFCTDGDASCRQVVNKLLSHPLPPTSSVGKIVCGLPLVDLDCGVHMETSYDPKHLV